MRGVAQRVGPCVVLGTAPARDGAPAWAPDSASGQKLAALAGVPAAQLGRYFALDNLVPLASCKARGVLATRQMLREAGLMYRLLPGWWYLLAGTEVVRSLGRRARPIPSEDVGLPWGMSDVRPLVWYESAVARGVRVAVLPHPSGKNRWYNDARCREAAERFLRAARWAGRVRAHDLWLRAREEGR